MDDATTERIALTWKREPIIEPLDIRTVFEHTPLDYYRYGEYPRFIRPVGAHGEPPWRWVRETPTGDSDGPR